MLQVLRVSNLRYRYSDGQPALQNISFSLHERESVAVFGANGSGKTTFLLHLNGLLRGQGEIEVCGKLLRDQTLGWVREKVGLIFQDSDDQLFLPTVIEDVAFGLLQRGESSDEARTHAEAMLDRLGIRRLAERAPYHLSAGEKKRVALAGVLVLQPEVLVLDEPTTYLDPPGQRDLILLLNELPQAKIIATHDVGFAECVASRAVFFEEGCVRDSGSVEEISCRYRWRVVGK